MKSPLVPSSVVKKTVNSALILLVFDLLVLLPLLRGALYFGDILLYFEPMTAYQKSVMHLGRLPLWNPFLLGGQPFHGNPQMWLFFPTTLLLYFVPSWLYLSLISLLAIWCCGFFCLLFLRRWVASETSALIGALCYMGSACLIARLQFPPMVLSALFFPALLHFVDKQIEQGHPRNVLWISLLVALTVLSAHPQMAYLIFACTTLYALARYWSILQEPPSSRYFKVFALKILPLGCALFLGIMLCSVQVLPVLQLTKESPREEMTVKEANRFYLEPKHLLTLIAPRYWGNPATGDFRERGNAWEPAIFVGWIPLLLLGVAIQRRRRYRVVQFWTLVALMSIWFAFGMHGGLFVLAFRLVPGLNKFHDPARFLFLTTFGIAVLAAIGFDQLRVSTRMVRCAVLVGVMAPLIWFGWDWNPVVNPRFLEHTPLALSSEKREGRVYVPRYRNLWRRYVNYTDFGKNDARTMTAMLDTLLPNIALRYGRETVNGYEPVPLSAPLAIELLTNALIERGEPNATRLLSLLQGEEILQVTEESLYHVRFAPKSFTKGVSLSENRDSLPRAWLVRRVHRVEGRERILAGLTSSDFVPRESALVSLGRDLAEVNTLRNLEWGSGNVEPSKVQEVVPSSNRFHVDAGGREGFLVTVLAAYPGWNAYLDGRRTQVYRTNGAMIGAVIPAGTHELELRYEPQSFRLGGYLSCVGVLAWVSLFLCFPRKR